MRVEWVELNNYGGFVGCHRFRLSDRGLVLVLGDNRDEPLMNSNGAGKSTVFDAIDWCWFGESPRGDHVDAVINDEIGKKCWVQTRAVDTDGTVVLVRRGRKPNGLQCWINDLEITALDSKATQCLINSNLGLDREIYHAAVYFAQEDRFHFADLKDKDRIAVLSRIYPELGQIDAYHEETKRLVAELTQPIAHAEKSIAQKQGQLQGLTQLNLEEQCAGYEANRQQRLAGVQAQLGGIAPQIDQLQQQQRDLGEVVTDPIPIPVQGEEHQAALANVRQALEYVQGWEKKKALAEADHQRLFRELDQVHRLQVGVCSTCRQPISGKHLQEESARWSSQLATAYAKSQEVSAQLMEARANLDQVKQAEHALDVAHKALVQQAVQQEYTRSQTLQRWQAFGQQIEGLKGQLGFLQNQYQQIQVEVNPHVEQIRQTKIQVDGLREAMFKLHTTIEGYQSRLAHVSFWLKGFSPKGLKSYILDAKLQEMTDAVNGWIMLLTGGTIWARFETQTMGRSTKSLANKLNIRIFRYRPDGTVAERNYQSWSGGEKKRVSLAIDFGLAQLIARRASKQYDCLILDEVFKYVDTRGGQAIMDMLVQMAREKNSIFVVEHDEAFQSHFPNTVTVRRQNCRSTFVEDQSDVAEQPKRKRPPKRRSIKRVPISANRP